MKYFTEIDGEPFEVELLDDHSLSVNGEVFNFNVQQGNRPENFSLILDGKSHQTWIESIEHQRNTAAPSLRVHLHGFDYEVICENERSRQLRQFAAAESIRDEEGYLTAPMPGLVLQILVEPGQQVNKGDGIVIVEAMKMENEIRATQAGKIKSIHVKPRQAVEKGEILAVIH
jgi:biotin carboxyl carrier protein